MAELYIGLMSGTSLDGVDGVLADFSGTGVRVLAHAARPFEAPLRAELLASGRAREAVLYPADLGGDFWLGNALRGLIPVRLRPA
mgnify:CR=1 FL=1